MGPEELKPIRYRMAMKWVFHTSKIFRNGTCTEIHEFERQSVKKKKKKKKKGRKRN